MAELSSENIWYLDELRRKNPEAYKRKLKILRMEDSEVPRTPIIEPRIIHHPEPKYTTHRYYTADPFPDEQMDYDDDYYDDYNYGEINLFEKPKGRLYLIDGDNHVYEGLSGVMNIRKTDTIIVWCTQPGLEDRIKRKGFAGRLDVRHVNRGDQAVDNQIKGVFGRCVRSGEYESVFIVSHDRGYDELISKYRLDGIPGDYSRISAIKDAIF